MNRNRKTRGILIGVLMAIGVFLVTSRQASADVIFGAPVNLGPPVNTSLLESRPMVSTDGLSLLVFHDGEGMLTFRTAIDASWNDPIPMTEGTIPTILSLTTADGLELYYHEIDGMYGSGDLVCITRKTINDDWSNPVYLGPAVNGSYQDISPAISPDGLELYFSGYLPTLARPGGYGHADLWVTKRETRNDPWIEPENLGAAINSSAQDARVSISANGLLLLFDSQRVGGYGQGDLYVTRRATLSDPWGAPVNLGPSVNSPAFEFFPFLSADGSTLFFASDRPGGHGGADIWQSSIEPIVDFNGDRIVNSADICIMVDYWGTDESLCDIGPTPLGDGIVDVEDLKVLAEHLFEDYRLIAHWKLDETEDYIAHDSVGENDSYIIGGALWQPAGGRVGGALLFDGIDDYISPPFILDPKAGSFSAFAWIKGGAPGQVIISQADGTGFGTRWLWADPSYGRLMSSLMHPPFDPLVSESVITDDQWHHIGLVYDIDGPKRYLYVDGKEVAKDTDFAGGIDSDGRMHFGANKTLDAAAFFSGLIDDVRIYDAALSAEEIAVLAQ